MSRILLLLPTATYRATDFLAAATELGVELVIGSERPNVLAAPMGERAVVIPLATPDVAIEVIVALDSRTPLDAVLAVDDQGVVVAAGAAERLGLRHNSSESVLVTRDKSLTRERLSAAELSQPSFRTIPPGADAVAAANAIGYPCVMKPVSRSASQGVIRVNDADEARRAAQRIRDILGDCVEPLIVEEFVPGGEVAIEGLLVNGLLKVLAVFDKPDPLVGPYFEETIYVTPSRYDARTLKELARVTAHAAEALGLREGPVHAELRIGPSETVTVLEVAARSIGGLCSRSLHFGGGASLEEIIIRHALGMDVGAPQRKWLASGVMMLPIRSAGVLERVSGQEEARSVTGVVDVQISIPVGRNVVPLPEGDRYLGFIFARGVTAQEVEATLRRAEACLEVQLR
ncbi:MAG: ATP-grasp domain-containing protein [Acidimicrobiales bacterium]